MGVRTPRTGGAAARLAAALTDDIDMPEGEEPEVDAIVMDDPTDEPEVEVIEDDPAPEDDLAPDYSHEAADEEPAPAPAAPASGEDAIASLQRQLDELRGERAATTARNVVEEEYANVSNVLAGAKAAAERAEGKLADAFKAQDAKGVAAAQRELTQITTDLVEIERIEGELRHKVKLAREGKLPVQQPQSQVDPFEAHISGMAPASQEWCRKHKADLTKPGRDNVAVAAHTLALARGLEINTPEYFKFLDAQMGYEAEPVTTPTPKTKTKTPAAARKPVGRAQTAAPAGGVSPRGGGVTEVRLSRAEVEIARSMGMTPKDYAANKAKIISNGKTGNGLRYSSRTDHSSR